MKENLIGKQFGLWTVIDEAESTIDKNGHRRCAMWLCRCICGNTKIISARQLRNGSNRYGCGCRGKKKIISRNDVYDCLECTLPTGKTFLFDECDLEIVMSRAWYMNSYGYIAAREGNRTILFHREITQPKKDMDVDHINGNRSDDRRCNLRIATRSQNIMNREYKTKSGFRNVFWQSSCNKWEVCIIKDGQKVFRKFYRDFDEACRIAKEKNIEIFGEYSIYNRRRKT